MLKQDYVELSIFKGLDASELRLIDPLLELCFFGKDVKIFDQGQLATFLFILLRGEVHVRFKPYDGPELTVARIAPGGVFGWSAAMGHSAYTSGAVAIQDSEVIRIRGDRLYQLCQDHPEIGVVILERLAGVIAERLRSTYNQILTILTTGMDLDEDYRRRLAKHE
jgi:CRP-like cAMP-binding protein